MKRTIRIAAASLLAAPVLALPAGAADAPQRHVRGTIATASATALTVTTATGSVVVPVGATTKVAGVVRASASEIVPGTFIGTANVPGAGPARALEVVVFPKAMAGTGEGDYPWDLPAGNRRTSMTNGTVAGPGGRSMMTNATVATVSRGALETVRLTYKGGSKSVAIPASAPIVRIVPGSRASLVAGAHVVVFPGANAAPAPFVIVGEKGVVPPM